MEKAAAQRWAAVQFSYFLFWGFFMRVRMLISIAGNAEPNYGLPEFSFAPGDTPDLHKDLAKAWIAAGHAEKFRKSDNDDTEVKETV